MAHSRPHARSEGLFAQEVSGELLVYDLDKDKVHHLNPSAALVWRSCDGKHSVADLTALLHEKLGLPEDERVTKLALDALAKARLLEDTPEEGYAKLTRRQLVRRVGVGLAALPLVATVLSPKAHAAASCQKAGTACNATKPCCPPASCIGGRCQ